MDRHVRATAAALAVRYPPWAPEVRCLDLAEEVGELARAVLAAEGHKAADGGSCQQVGEALCGVLLGVFALADHYRVELDALYPALLAQLTGARSGLGR